jgi:hypothetical protein
VHLSFRPAKANQDKTRHGQDLGKKTRACPRPAFAARAAEHRRKESERHTGRALVFVRGAQRPICPRIPKLTRDARDAPDRDIGAAAWTVERLFAQGCGARVYVLQT